MSEHLKGAKYNLKFLEFQKLFYTLKNALSAKYRVIMKFPQILKIFNYKLIISTMIKQN